MLFPGVAIGCLLSSALSALGASVDNTLVVKAVDPCAAIAGQKWVAPKDVRACFTSFKVDPVIKANV